MLGWACGIRFPRSLSNFSKTCSPRNNHPSLRKCLTIDIYIFIHPIVLGSYHRHAATEDNIIFLSASERFWTVGSRSSKFTIAISHSSEGWLCGTSTSYFAQPLVKTVISSSQQESSLATSGRVIQQANCRHARSSRRCER